VCAPYPLSEERSICHDGPMSDDDAPRGGPIRRAFPPLPSVKPPTAGRGTDPRQASALRIIEGLAGRLPSALHTGSGYRASCVDLGELKELVESGTKRLTMSQLEARFHDDIQSFVHSVVTMWVQRPKEISSELRENGIHVRVKTQDDHGYYDYAFDVFPRGT
jgi:hypothetical protein